MKLKTYFGLLIAFWIALPAAQAGTKEELLRLQSDVLQLQKQMKQLEKTFEEKTDGLKSLVVQLNDQVASSGLILQKLSTIIENQESGGRSADQEMLQEIRALSGKVDDAVMRISALAQQLDDLKVQSKPLNQEATSQLSEPAMFKQASDDFVEGNLDLAIKEYTEYLNIYPGGERAATALYNIGEAYLRQNKPRQAIDAFTRVLYDYPDSETVPSALFRRAIAELAVRETDNAIADLKNIIEKYPKSAEAESAKTELRKLGISLSKPTETRRKTR